MLNENSFVLGFLGVKSLGGFQEEEKRSSCLRFQ